MYKLPNDILRYILLLNNADESDDDAIDWSDDLVDGNGGVVDLIMSNSQVCRVWRTAALQNRMVWLRFIDWVYSPLAWIEELLRRSDSISTMSFLLSGLTV